MNKDQQKSLVLSAVKIISGILIAKGFTNAASIIDTPDVIGFVLAMVALISSHFHHADAALEDVLSDHGSAETTPAAPAQPNHATNEKANSLNPGDRPAAATAPGADKPDHA